MPGTQDARQVVVTRQIDDRRLDPDSACTAIEHQRHRITQLFADMRRIGRTDAAKPIGRRSREAAHAVLPATRMFIGAKQLQGKRVSRHSHTHRFLSARHRIGYVFSSFENQRERPRPECFGQIPGNLRDIPRPLIQMRRARQMHNQRVIGRAPLGGEDARHRLRIGGIGAKAVVTGDITQIDLPKGHKSGLKEAIDVLHDVRGLAFTQFRKEDVVRHPLVARIVDAYEKRQQPT